MGEQKVVEIPYEPRDWALDFHDTQKRWKVLVLHRRAGKTTAAINHLQRDALTTPDSRYAYVCPTYKQAKNVAWDIIKNYSLVVPGIEYNESELTAKYPNGSRITLYGADNPDSLRGIGLWGVVFDEYSQQPSNIFTEVIRPALADHEGYAIWIGTPKGKNEFYRLYAGIDHEGKPLKDLDDWYRVLLTVEQTKIISQKELDSARAAMSEDEFQQEWYCSFEAAIKGAYYATQMAKARKQGRIKLVPHDSSLLTHTVWDLGVGKNLVCGFFQRVSNEVKLIDTWQGSGDQGIIDALLEIKKKPYFFGRHMFPHDVEAREETTGKTRKEQIETAGFEVTVVPQIGVDNGIEAAKRMFDRLWIDETHCVDFIDAISQYRAEWDDKKGMFKDTPYHDWTSHWADMLRMAAVLETKMTNEKLIKVSTYKPEWKGFNRRR
jgi:phage terminase large subunit